MGTSRRQLKAMLRKNWLLKIRHPFVTCGEILLPTLVMLMLIGVRTRVDTRIHPAQPYIRKGMFVEVGKSDVSPSFQQILELLLAKGEYLAFAPDTEETRMMLDIISLRFPLLKVVAKVYKDEPELEAYIRSDLYGTCSPLKNCTTPRIKGAIVFHEQGPQLFDYSIRLNHSWAFSGFPDVKTIMDVNGPYLDDLELGVNTVSTLQYGFSGFLTLQQLVDSFIIFASQQNLTDLAEKYSFQNSSAVNVPLMHFTPSNIRIAPFPTREYTDNEFQSIIKKVMGVLYLLGFLYPISRLISYSVFEKEHKIKEGLYMMGLKDEIFYLSWFITYSIQFAISSGIITACTMGSLFMYSDKSLVFVYFFLFGISAIMLSFLISTFFTRAKTAVAVGTLSFLGAFFPYYTVNDTDVPMILKVVASLLSPTAFALGTVNFADYERAHVGVRWSNIWRASSGVNFLVCLFMMLFDSLLYCAIGLYLDKVLPRENGVRYPWNFLFKCFWQKKSGVQDHAISHIVKTNGKPLKNEVIFAGSGVSEPTVEAVSLDMKQQELDGRCIQIRNLRKVHITKKGKCCAVNSLQLTLYENQILALLGHNGAGKSTTISMLVGLLPPTSGDALVFGRNILTDMDEIRKGLGVCPQNDILLPELTVKEHLEIFAILKGVKEEMLESIVTEMVDEVGLADKVNTVVSALSGGMKRKLSLGIALIGNSKVIILDEPTSGMDPYSMRSTWQLIKKIKKGRIILLTTHSMDEADILGDRIAIMANGSLRCCGSSLFLKHLYGVGYTLTLVKSAPSASVAADIVHRHVPSATRLSDVGTEISFRLPLASSSSFESMFREIESCMGRSIKLSGTSASEECHLGIESYGISVTTLEEVFLRVAGCDFDNIEHIEPNKAFVFSDSVVTEASLPYSPTKVSNSKQICGNFKKVPGMICTAFVRASCLVLAMLCSFVRFLGFRCFGSCFVMRSTFLGHCKALLVKRAISAGRDRRTVAFQLVIPAIFLLLGLLFLELKTHPDQQSLTLTTSNFNPLLRGGGGGGPIPFDLFWPISKKIAPYIEGGWIQRFELSSYRFPNAEIVIADAIEAAGPRLGPLLISMSEFLMGSLNESYQSRQGVRDPKWAAVMAQIRIGPQYIFRPQDLFLSWNKRYGAVVMDDKNDDGSLGYTVLYNSSCQHAAPTYVNVMNAAILRLATRRERMMIQTRNHPLPMTKSQHSQRHDLDAFSAAIIVCIAFSFVPASFAVSIVKEREVKAKHQQLISGVSILSYWISTYIWDFISFLVPSAFAIILFYIFGLDQFIGGGCFFPTITIFLEYGLAVAASTYCLTFFFSDHSMAQNVVLLVHFFTGLILMVISFIMGLIPATKNANLFLKNFFRLSPGFCFADGLASLALRRQGMKLESSDKVLDWNITGASICYLGLESIVYFILTIGLEVLPSHTLTSVLMHWWRTLRDLKLNNSHSYLEPLLKSSCEALTFEADEDVDVQAERHRVISGSADSSIIYLRNLRKVYPGGINQSTKVAVHSLSFSVQEGECFGFLGTNGAGKTTTLSMLTGEECPTDGTAYIFGNDICSQPKAARRHIGYCPQFDALLEFLTAREHLELYARIKGVPENMTKEVVMEKLVEFDLLKHADKPSFSLSGGNKRKLSVAIAMIGDPPIVILDEPSTGMDPIAKRFMWEVISQLSTRRGKTAVILTTHSMNEAQALCTRIGIMVGGRLRCIGSPQYLKTRFGNHLELEVKPTEVSSTELNKLCQSIQERLFEFRFHSRSILGDIEVCIGGTDSITLDETVAEISLTQELIMMIGHWLGNEERIKALISCKNVNDGLFGEQLTEQLFRDGGIALPIFSEWWLAKEKFSKIDSFILTSFPGTTCLGCNGLSVKYQLPYGEDSSLADVFGHLERNRNQLGIAEYSISQSTLETIFNHFASNP